MVASLGRVWNWFFLHKNRPDHLMPKKYLCRLENNLFLFGQTQPRWCNLNSSKLSHSPPICLEIFVPTCWKNYRSSMHVWWTLRQVVWSTGECLMVYYWYKNLRGTGALVAQGRKWSYNIQWMKRKTHWAWETLYVSSMQLFQVLVLAFRSVWFVRLHQCNSSYLKVNIKIEKR